MVLVNESEGNVMLCATAHGWTTAESNLTVLLSYSGTARGSCSRYDNCFRLIVCSVQLMKILWLVLKPWRLHSPQHVLELK